MSDGPQKLKLPDPARIRVAWAGDVSNVVCWPREGFLNRTSLVCEDEPSASYAMMSRIASRLTSLSSPFLLMPNSTNKPGLVQFRFQRPPAAPLPLFPTTSVYEILDVVKT